MPTFALKGRDLAHAADSELAELARSGSDPAFREIMRRHNRRLYRVARGVVGDPSEAEDVVQETYLRAFAHLGDFRGDAALSTWLTRIALNEALGRKRRRKATVELKPDQQSGTLVATVRGEPSLGVQWAYQDDRGKWAHLPRQERVLRLPGFGGAVRRVIGAMSQIEERPTKPFTLYARVIPASR